MREDDADLLRAAARLRTALSFLIVAALLLLLLERLAYAGAFLGRPPAPKALAAGVGRQIVYTAPALLYLLALWQLRRALASAARGAPFGPLVPLALERVGWLLIAGAATTLFAMPAVHRLLGSGLVKLIDYDLATIILAAIGVGLTFLGRLIRRAARIEGELDEMF